jgi:hypothetical protein
MTRQETINKAVAWAVAVADDPAHGYDQQNRWGADYDCSSFVITAWQQAGVPVKTSGASYTGNMYWAFINCGFRDVTNSINLNTGAGLEKGDVVLNTKHHTELYIGNGKMVKASINELGSVTGGKTGDQTGREIYVGNYYKPSYGWDYVLRYYGGETEEAPKADPVTLPCYVKLPMLQRGDKGEYVRALQILLIGRGYSCGSWGADGDFGGGTESALQDFQSDHGLFADGVAGNLTYAKLWGG